MNIAVSKIAMLSCFIFMLASCGGGGGDAGGVPQEPNSVDRDSDGLIEIFTLEELDWVRNDLLGQSLTDHEGNSSSAGCPSSGCVGYELVNDLDFDTSGDGVIDSADQYYDYDGDGSNSGWLPIGNSRESFAAVFEGNGFSINNLYIHRDRTDLETAGLVLGLFGSIESLRTVNRIGISNLSIDGEITGASKIGFLAGRIGASNHEGVYLENININGTVNNTFNAPDISLFVGTLSCSESDLAVENITINGVINGIGNSTGALSGNLNLYDVCESVSISDVTFNGSLTGSDDAAGLIAWINSDSEVEHQVNIDNVEINADISGESDVGGIIGWATFNGGNGQLAIANSRVNGNISARSDDIGDSNAGGLLGFLISFNNTNSLDILFDNNLFDGSIDAEGDYVGGAIGQMYLVHQSSFNMTKNGVIADIRDTTSGSINYGGLIGYLYTGDLSGSATIQDNFSISHLDVETDCTGGLIGMARNGPGQDQPLYVRRNFVNSMINSSDMNTGGLIGCATVWNENQLSISSNLLNSTLESGMGALVLADDSTLNVEDSLVFRHNLVISEQDFLPFVSDQFTVNGIDVFALEELECPTSDNNSTCLADTVLYEGDDWSRAVSDGVWDFGSDVEMPGINIQGVVYRANDYSLHFSE